MYNQLCKDLNIKEEIFSFKMWPQEKGLGHHNAAGDDQK